MFDQAYWDQDAERLAAHYEEFRGQPRDHFTATLWREHWVDHQTTKQLALKVDELQAVLEAAKPVRKRATRVPKTALPELNDTDVE